MGVSEGGHCQVVFEKQTVVGCFFFSRTFFIQNQTCESEETSPDGSALLLSQFPVMTFFNGFSGRTGPLCVRFETHTHTQTHKHIQTLIFLEDGHIMLMVQYLFSVSSYQLSCWGQFTEDADTVFASTLLTEGRGGGHEGGSRREKEKTKGVGKSVWPPC